MTVSLSFTQRMRLALALRAHAGTRKDVEMRVVMDLEEKIAPDAEELDEVAHALPGGDKYAVDRAELAKKDALPRVSVDLTKAEATVLLKKLNAMELTTADLRTWADDLGKQLEDVK
jgi:hypothetical protein